MSDASKPQPEQPSDEAGEITDLWFAVHGLSDAVRAIAATVPYADTDPLGQALGDIERALHGRELGR